MVTCFRRVGSSGFCLGVWFLSTPTRQPPELRFARSQRVTCQNLGAGAYVPFGIGGDSAHKIAHALASGPCGAGA